MIKGVLFDMDGVLVDSEEFICRAAIRMFRERGIAAAPEDFIPYVGMGENRYIGGVAEKYGMQADMDDIKSRTYEIYGEITKGKLHALPGAAEFIERCRKEGLKLALATSADRIKMEINLREIGLQERVFDAAVNGLDVERKKPFPDIYIEAARRIGLDPGQCLVVEDAVSGIRAAKAAGSRCLAVASSFDGKLLSEADWVCSSLNEVPGEALKW
jgi:HAD superfamily hydrolase (TIGR01509 family)